MVSRISGIFAKARTLGSRLVAAGKTLRSRLMAWNAALILATALACFIGVREGIRRTVLAQMDDVLADDIEEISLSVAALDGSVKKPANGLRLSGLPDVFLEALNRKAIGHQHNGWFVELADESGARLWTSDPTLHSSVIEASRPAPYNWEGCRILERRQRTASGRVLRIRVGAPRDFIDRDVENIDSVAAWVVGILLLVAPLIGYWLAGRAIRPLTQIIETTARLRPNQLDERLPIRQTGDELDKLSRTINQFLDRIAAYLTQNQDLLANSAHELRTPLTAIRSSVEVALGGARTAREYQELLSEVIDECQSLERLVNQLLLLAESESERLGTRSEPLDFSTLVDRCVEMFSAVAEARHIGLSAALEPEVRVMGVRHHLRQLVNNLLDNALKFTDSGGTVSVEVKRLQDGAALLCVRDTGRGISETDLPHIFERFFRGDKSRQRSERTTGTGLGLCICRSIVAAHGGEIGAESREGTGTTLTTRLPAFSHLEASAQRHGAPPASPVATSYTS